MLLCSSCVAIKLENLLTGLAIPWNRTTSDLCATAVSCELCALVISACRNKTLLVDQESPLYIAGGCNLGLLDTHLPKSRWLDLMDVYIGVPEAVGLASGEDARTRVSDMGGASSFKDRRLKAELATLRVVCDDFSPLVKMIGCRPIGPSDDLASIQKWAKRCDSCHDACRIPGEVAMPTRVIDVGKDGSAPKLVETAGSSGRYLALSHRWGGSRIIQTTSVNLERHLNNIPFQMLCATFQDAVVMTRKLGFTYLWIDSLCIIQDSPQDWEREATRMSSIYRNAALTLAAACATSGDTGLFLPQRSTTRVNMFDSGFNASYFLENVQAEGFIQEVVNGPLNTRAWCLQERCLSPRTVHFGRTQLYWECQAVVWEEKSTHLVTAIDRFSGHLTDGFIKHLSTFPWRKEPMPRQRQAKGDEYSTWYWLITQYSRRDMTVVDDKLPAISGLASVFASYRDDTYLAGLWQGDLAIGLLWCAQGGRRLKKVDKYRAPSWSWAAWDGAIDVEYSWDGRVEIEDVSVMVDTPGLDPFGKVQSGFVELRALFEKISLGSAINPANSSFSWSCANVQLLGSDGTLVGEGCLEDRCNVAERTDQVFCIMIFRVEVGFRPFPLAHLDNKGDWAWCLLLRGTTDGDYKRIGLAQIHQAYFSGKTKSITIV